MAVLQLADYSYKSEISTPKPKFSDNLFPMPDFRSSPSTVEGVEAAGQSEAEVSGEVGRLRPGRIAVERRDQTYKAESEEIIRYNFIRHRPGICRVTVTSAILVARL